MRPVGGCEDALGFWDGNAIKFGCGSSSHGTAETNPTRNHEVEDLIPGLTQWVKYLVLL